MERKYPSKILLFGEYGILMGSMALAIPYPAFGGSLETYLPLQAEDQEFAAESRQHLKLLLDHFHSDTSGFTFLDLEGFWRDLDNGLWFNSNIPQGYGAGSSGALTASIFDRYGFPGIKAAPIAEVRRNLAAMEALFHGKSSGLDPLVSWLQIPVLIDHDNQAVAMENERLNPEIMKGFFLIDTQAGRKTGNLVEWFLRQTDDWEFLRAAKEVFLPGISQAIHGITVNNPGVVEEAVGSISSFQMQYLTPMIPGSMSSHFEYGLETGEFYLKLCGSGGGGFMLGFTQNPLKTWDYFQRNGLELHSLITEPATGT